MKAQIINIDNQKDRILLYVKQDYYVIVGANTTFNIGDEIDYEPYGYNFGFLTDKKE